MRRADLKARTQDHAHRVPYISFLTAREGDNRMVYNLGNGANWRVARRNAMEDGDA